jgi:hypothetical protein
MRTSSVLALATVLCLSAGLARSQTESGFPLCKADGSMPDGYNQCECQKTVTYRSEFRDSQREFSVALPDGVVAIGGCVPGSSFKIYLPHPERGELGWDFPRNMIWVAGSERSRETFQQIIEAWKQARNEDKDFKEGQATDRHLAQPEQTSLASLPALRLRATWTEIDHGNLISEMVIANNPEKDIVYQIGIISPVNRWEKNRKMFEDVVGRFRYLPQDKHE